MKLKEAAQLVAFYINYQNGYISEIMQIIHNLLKLHCWLNSNWIPKMIINKIMYCFYGFNLIPYIFNNNKA